jgi:hypothetical protein
MDADAATRAAVSRNREALVGAVQAVGRSVCTTAWAGAQGLDDVLVAGGAVVARPWEPAVDG